MRFAAVGGAFVSVAMPRRGVGGKKRKVKVQAPPVSPARALPRTLLPGAFAETLLAAESRPDGVVLELGQIYRAQLLRRPSASVRSGFVADVKLLPGGEEVLCHTPCLDLGGLLHSGADLVLTRNATKPTAVDKNGVEKKRTQFALQLVLDRPSDGAEGTWVGAHPRLAERVFEAAFDAGLLGDDFAAFGKMQKQVTMYDERERLHRVDYVLSTNEEVESPSGAASPAPRAQAIIEVKNVVLADFEPAQKEHATARLGRRGAVYINHAQPYVRHALFPFGKRDQQVESDDEYASGRRVVSSRAVRHMRHLSSLARKMASDGDAGAPISDARVCFIVNRGDCGLMRACGEACAVFAEAVELAALSGVKVYVFGVRWEAHGRAVWLGSLPYVYLGGAEPNPTVAVDARKVEVSCSDEKPPKQPRRTMRERRSDIPIDSDEKPPNERRRTLQKRGSSLADTPIDSDEKPPKQIRRSERKRRSSLTDIPLDSDEKPAGERRKSPQKRRSSSTDTPIDSGERPPNERRKSPRKRRNS